MAFEGRTEEETATTCPYCGVGCGVLVQPDADGQSAVVRGDPAHPSNFGKLCSKGSALGETLKLDERILYPELNGDKTNWDTALDYVADGFRETISTYGPDSVAFYVSGQILTEDYYVANKLMKGFIGSSNIDTNSRLCMASSVVGHKRAFGTDTVPGSYSDLDEADLVVITGSNFAWCHPVLHQRLLKAKEARGTKIVVIDPRATATSDAADLHLKIKPGGDVALYNWLLWNLAQSTAFNETFVGRHTAGLSKALSTATDTQDADISRLTGLDLQDLKMFLGWLIQFEKTVTIYSQGINQSSSGSNKVNAILNTHIITGRIGKPGMGPFSITGQPNAMGGREVGGLANQLAAHMDFSPEDIDRVGRFWSSDKVPEKPGLKAVDMFDAVADGRIKAIWIMATNPVVTLPQADKVRSALEACPLVVVSDVSARSDTLTLANVKLPATAWGEKSGTVTNSERRISRQRSFLKPPGEARHDWWALCEVAKRLGFTGFEFDGPVDIYREHAALSGFENNNTRDFDIGADADISAELYDALAPFQWPRPRKTPAGSTIEGNHRFFADGSFYTPDRKARILETPVQDPVKSVTSTYPFILNTGRVRDHWHTMTRTGTTARLASHIAEPFLEIHPQDAERLGLEQAELAQVASEHGQAILRVLVTDRVAQGQVFAPMHWTARYSSAGRIDALVGPETDLASGQPDSKYTPVKVEPFLKQNSGFGVFQHEPTEDALSKLDYWALAKAPLGWRLEFATDRSCEEIKDVLITDTDCTEVFDSRGGYRGASFSAGTLAALVIVGASRTVSADRSWLAEQVGRRYLGSARFSLLAGRARSGEATGRIICSCLGVGVNEICKSIEAGAQTVAGIGNATGAGTNCGSCKPELRDFLKAASKSRKNLAAE